MIERKRYEFIKEKYGYYSSWAIWADEDEKPKSNVGDLTILDPDINPALLSQLNPNVIFVGLNISRDDIKYPLANFHDSSSRATDYKIRYAFRGSPYWGAYMTDIIKDFEEKSSRKLVSFLKSNHSFEEENVKIFREEVNDLETTSPTLIAFGNDTYNILKRNFVNEIKILKVPHYANYTSKEKYRDQVKSIW